MRTLSFLSAVLFLASGSLQAQIPWGSDQSQPQGNIPRPAPKAGVRDAPPPAAPNVPVKPSAAQKELVRQANTISIACPDYSGSFTTELSLPQPPAGWQKATGSLTTANLGRATWVTAELHPQYRLGAWRLYMTCVYKFEFNATYAPSIEYRQAVQDCKYTSPGLWRVSGSIGSGPGKIDITACQAGASQCEAVCTVLP